MTHVATLIANPGNPVLDERLLAQARSALAGTENPLWLAPGIAADIPFSADRNESQRETVARLHAALSRTAIDVVVQPRAHRRKKLFVADMDSTMIGQECIDELADLVGLKEHVAAITERAMRGEIAFEPALRERVALLKGLPENVVEDVIAQRITLNPGARTLVQTMRAFGAYTCLVSGGFTLFTQRVAEMIGFHEERANTLLIEGGQMTGKVKEPILGREAKLSTLQSLTEQLRLTAEDTLAVGDGANDLAMITHAGLGVAYHAKPAVAEAASAQIDHGDLTALLYLQGYRQDEFAQ